MHDLGKNFMNERIKLLLERAEYQTQKQSGSDWEVHVEPSREQIFEKFAELIVKETMQVVANQLPSNQYLDVAHAVIEHYKDDDVT
jgi:hypothetical protein